MKLLQDKTIVLGVTGSIAAYKAVEIARLLVKAGAMVEVIMTESATKFVTPLTFQAITHRKVIISLLDAESELEIDHIACASSADAVIIAPATANTIAKCAHGFADNPLTATLLATNAPVIIAPAMETRMWDHPATQENIDLLQKRGVNVIEPEVGHLASGSIGAGRMARPDAIVDTAKFILGGYASLSGVHIVITNGPTREMIDPIRFISNSSSGKMGLAIAEAARNRGAHVTLVSGPVSLPIPIGVDSVSVTTALEMNDAVLKLIAKTDVLVGVAAVSDYRSQTLLGEKIKKTQDIIMLELIPNPDILSEVAKWKKAHKKKYPILIGFAAETENIIGNAQGKLILKKLDLIIANDARATFGSDTITPTLIEPSMHPTELETCSKQEFAEILIDWISHKNKI